MPCPGIEHSGEGQSVNGNALNHLAVRAAPFLFDLAMLGPALVAEWSKAYTLTPCLS